MANTPENPEEWRCNAVNLDLTNPMIIALIAVGLGLGYIYVLPLVMAYWWLFILGIGAAVFLKFYLAAKA